MPRPDRKPQSVFVEQYLPEISSRAEMLLRDHGPEAREEAQQEIVAQSWAGFLSAWHRGRADRVTAFTLTNYAHRHYRAGRRLAVNTLNDAMSERSRAGRRVRLERANGSVLDLTADPAELVRWRMDLRQVIGLLTVRQRQVLIMTAAGWRNLEMAEVLGVTPSGVVRIQERIGAVFRRVGYGW